MNSPAEAICIIPARGGSKGIPRKNVARVHGRPLIAWSIGQALEAVDVDRVIVTTDDAEIADVAESYGAEVFNRSPETATDHAASEDALIEVLDDNPCRVVVFLQATSPIRQFGQIDRAIELVRTACDSMFSCRHVEGYTWTEAGGIVKPNYGLREPRQLWGCTTLEENGSIYAFHADRFLVHKTRLFGRIGFLPMHPLDSFQVDTPSDLELIRTLLPLRLGHASHATAAR